MPDLVFIQTTVVPLRQCAFASASELNRSACIAGAFDGAVVDGGTVVVRFGAYWAYDRPVLARTAARANATMMRIAVPPQEIRRLTRQLEILLITGLPKLSPGPGRAGSGTFAGLGAL